MEIPQNITRDHLIRAISKIDAEGFPNDADSQYYDVLYNEKRYPPKVVVSYANLFANGEILDRNKFSGGLETPCFRLLEDRGFLIINKANRIVENIKLFSKIYKTEVDLKHGSELKSYVLLVNNLPGEVRSQISNYSKYITIKGSIGQGTNTNYPWLGIFDKRVSTGATNGFYVVLLFSDDFDDIYLTLNQGSTVQTEEQIGAYRNFVFSLYPSVEGFEKGRIPKGGLVKTKSGSAAKNGKKYEDTNIFYRKYKIDTINEEDFNTHLMSIVKVYTDCAEKYSSATFNSNSESINLTDMNFAYKKFHADLNRAGLFVSPFYSLRFICSMLTKPFVILTGLSGSGKTKLAQAFAMWICENENQYCIVPVGADWTNREPLLGFPNSLESEKYVNPENRVLDLIIQANNNLDKPFFLILDEMNLSHVERYFADFLSVMESNGKIALHSGESNWNGVPSKISFPKNLFIVGTVNIDETTYMFSPKVLDRANVIEFSINKAEMDSYLMNNFKVNLSELEGLGASMAASFVELAKDESLQLTSKDEINKLLITFFAELKKIGAEFGYRSASEILRLAAIINKLELESTFSEVIDVAIMQKLLPKVHGSRRKLEPVLKTLGTLCLQEGHSFDDILSSKLEVNFKDSSKIKYPISLEKILRMYDNLISNGFTSYAEA